MNIILISIAILLLIVGIIGCILPAIPGPPIAYSALLLLLMHSNEFVHPSGKLLWSYGIAVLIITALDYVLPVWGTKRFGGSKAGERGSLVGLVVSFIFPIAGPFTILIGPFVGAVVGELIVGKDKKTALNSGIGSFLGFLAGTVLKLGMVALIIWKFVALLWI